jgi:hypothetical protein
MVTYSIGLQPFRTFSANLIFRALLNISVLRFERRGEMNVWLHSVMA